MKFYLGNKTKLKVDIFISSFLIIFLSVTFAITIQTFFIDKLVIQIFANNSYGILYPFIFLLAPVGIIWSIFMFCRELIYDLKALRLANVNKPLLILDKDKIKFQIENKIFKWTDVKVAEIYSEQFRSVYTRWLCLRLDNSKFRFNLDLINITKAEAYRIFSKYVKIRKTGIYPKNSWRGFFISLIAVVILFYFVFVFKLS